MADALDAKVRAINMLPYMPNVYLIKNYPSCCPPKMPKYKYTMPTLHMKTR